MTATHSFSSDYSPLTLEARGLTCVRGERRLFTNLHLSISAGECLHVRGENGVGKTSLLRILTGLSKAESGEIFWNQQSIGKDLATYHRALLFLGHRDALKEDLTAFENLKLYAAIDDIDLLDEKVLAALWRFGLRGREYLPVNCLSAGQKRRVLMARMLTRQAKLWVLDEPFNALDVQAIQVLQALIAEHVEQGGLVVLTSHQELNLPHLRMLDL
ncbi:cytochrome c biogenesis heme-transporting ATPase CcmA [Polynucleobacter sp. MWH-Braz-FAM2G]|uniref:cytochrome c biogenesis heme-transporting ATPase CcmA n=1 Tax=Polynucleobacter sp. MWH-Braz-FAM2G TaxID=1855883 RepID=UPI001BFED60C|nr:cytochrome c biogenesis heme-transporting ATPase CcmA [Polynucleobacter sp. MWH-Braz-FAM2G]QWD90368.1 cytochrome c biogenesis heme-transporting ATPase CcmA [Polynucleobacter sp. MWH-Braz-FAM2G]